MPQHPNTAERGPSRLVGVTFGIGYLLAGSAGFVVSGGYGIAGSEGGLLLGIFMVNPLHNVVHLLLGALLLVGAARGELVAARVDMLAGGGYAVLGLVGLFSQRNDELNLLALNWQDNVLHFGSAGLLMAAGLLSPRTSTPHR